MAPIYSSSFLSLSLYMYFSTQLLLHFTSLQFLITRKNAHTHTTHTHTQTASSVMFRDDYLFCVVRCCCTCRAPVPVRGLLCIVLLMSVQRTDRRTHTSITIHSSPSIYFKRWLTHTFRSYDYIVLKERKCIIIITVILH